MGISNDIRPRQSQRSHHRELEPVEEIIPVKEAKDEIKAETPSEAEKEKVESKFSNSAKFDGFDDFFTHKPSAKKEKPEKAKKETTENDDTKKPAKKSLAAKIFNRWLILFLLVFVLALLIFQNFDLLKSYVLDKTDTDKTTQDAEKIIVAPTDYTTGQTNTATQAPTTTPATTTPSATTTPTATASTAVKIKLLNGNGISKSADTIKKQLEAAGYTIGFIGNANRFTYTQTYIYYQLADKSTAEALKTIMSTRDVVLVNDESVAKVYDIVIVIGKT